MASIRKTGKKYVAEVRCKGAYKSKRFSTKAEAQAWALELEARLGRNPGMLLGHTLREAMQKYSDEVSPSRKGARWEQVRLAKLERDALADMAVADLEHEHIQGWIERQTISASSINRELNLLSAVFRECRTTWKWMAHNPMTDVKRPQKAPPRDRLIAEAEVELILKGLEYEETAPVRTTRQQIAVAFLLALETAMRQGELWSLDWSCAQLSPLLRNAARNQERRETRCGTL